MRYSNSIATSLTTVTDQKIDALRGKEVSVGFGLVENARERDFFPPVNRPLPGLNIEGLV
jgi:hypothetical protein